MTRGSRELIAHYQAGHGVMAYVEKIALNEATIIPNEKTQGRFLRRRRE